LPQKKLTKDLEKSPSYFEENETEQRFHPIILQAARRFQVDPALVKAIIMAESGYDPRAISKVGAKGLMQLMPATAEELGVEDIFDPKHNINAGVGYFKKLLNRFDGDIKLALAAYNAGTGKVRQYQGIPPFKATRYYIKKVFEYYQIYKKQKEGEPDRA
jgi:soluble lytic murein transglycosylase-like protein